MATKMENIITAENAVAKMQRTIASYHALYKADGTIDASEIAELEAMLEDTKLITAKLARAKKALEAKETASTPQVEEVYKQEEVQEEVMVSSSGSEDAPTKSGSEEEDVYSDILIELDFTPTAMEIGEKPKPYSASFTVSREEHSNVESLLDLEVTFINLFDDKRVTKKLGDHVTNPSVYTRLETLIVNVIASGNRSGVNDNNSWQNNIFKPLPTPRIDVEFIPNYYTFGGSNIPIPYEDGDPQTFKFLLDKDSQYVNKFLNPPTVTIEIGGFRKGDKVTPVKKTIPCNSFDGKRFTVEFTLGWYGDGEKEYVIMVNGLCTEDEAKKAYWEGTDVMKAVQEETGCGDDSVMYLDGDAGGDKISENQFYEVRYEKGRLEAIQQVNSGLFNKLARTNGKITQRIQVYSHSRGGAYAEGFIDALKESIQRHKDEFYNADDVIDIVIHIDPHQSHRMSESDNNHRTIAVSHNNSVIGTALIEGNDVKNITTNGPGGHPGDHSISTFGYEVEQILDIHNDCEVNGINGKEEYSKYSLKNEVLKDAFDGVLNQAGLALDITNDELYLAMINEPTFLEAMEELNLNVEDDLGTDEVNIIIKDWLDKLSQGIIQLIIR